MKWIVIAGLTGWGGIVWLSWLQADRLLRWACASYTPGCRERLAAQRDAVLTNGLTVALVALLGVACFVAWRRSRLNRPNQAPREAKPVESSRLLP